MSVELKVDLEAYPKGTPLSFNGLGTVENGSSVTLTDEQELSYVNVNGMSVADGFKDQEGITVGGSPTVKIEDMPPVNDVSGLTPIDQPTEEKVI